ncbi:MAG: TVP38/TMEM64 family protein [Acutalibacteraceae bacterium]
MRISAKCSLNKQQKVSLACAAVSVILFSLLFVVFGSRMLEMLREPKLLTEYIDGFGAYSQLVFIAVRTLQTVVKVIPGEPVEIAAGLAFGTFGGLALCLAGTAVGSAIIVLLTRTLGMKFVTLFVSEEKLRSCALLKSSDRLYLLLFFFYLIPGTPKDIFTYAAALTDIKLWKFFVITGIARIPSIITSTMCGASLCQKNYLAAAVIYGVTLLMSVAGMLVYRKIKA